MQKIFFFDIDGTLAMHGQIPPGNLEALRRLKQAGHLTFVCTGRPVFYAEALFGSLVSGYIACNGRYLCYQGIGCIPGRFPPKRWPLIGRPSTHFPPARCFFPNAPLMPTISAAPSFALCRQNMDRSAFSHSLRKKISILLICTMPNQRSATPCAVPLKGVWSSTIMAAAGLATALPPIGIRAAP